MMKKIEVKKKKKKQITYQNKKNINREKRELCVHLRREEIAAGWWSQHGLHSCQWSSQLMVVVLAVAQAVGGGGACSRACSWGVVVLAVATERKRTW